MKNKTTILFGITLAVVAGLFGTGIFGVTITKTDQTDPFATALFSGHVTTILKDSDGNVKAYRQTDNIIVNQGENCALKLLFSNGTGTSGRGVAAAGNTVCTGENQFGYRFIEIGNTTGGAAGTTPPSPISTDARLYSSHNNTGSAGNNPGLLRKLSSISTTGWTNSTSATTSAAASVVMSATFTNSGSSAKTVNESGLFNSTITAVSGLNSHQQDSMFARQVFSTISMAANDQLTVQWTINVGGTTAIT